MRYAQYLKLEGQITAADSNGIMLRWEYGRRLLTDDSAIAASGKSLKHGVLDRLISDAKSKGYHLYEREIRRRMQCARAYPAEAQIAEAAANFQCWWDLCNANFPLDAKPPDERIRSADKRGGRLLPERDETSLFPHDRFGQMSTVAELTKYAEEMTEITARFKLRDDERNAYLRRLVEAVAGDMNATWQEASDALAEGDAS